MMANFVIKPIGQSIRSMLSKSNVVYKEVVSLESSVQYHRMVLLKLSLAFNGKYLPVLSVMHCSLMLMNMIRERKPAMSRNVADMNTILRIYEVDRYLNKF